MSHNVASGSLDFDKDARVRDNDGEARYEEAESEEELLWRLAVFTWQNGAREGGRVETQVAPDAEQWRRHHQEAKEPRAEDHQHYQRPPVDLVVPRGRGNQYIPVVSKTREEEKCILKNSYKVLYLTRKKTKETKQNI